MLIVGRNVRQAKLRTTYNRDLLSVANNVHFIVGTYDNNFFPFTFSALI